MRKEKTTSATQTSIKEKARLLFLKNGYRNVTVRDIAKASGTNIALISYYFGNKEKLHKEILAESIELFRGGLHREIHNAETTLDEKLTNITAFYIDTLTSHPDLSAFVMNELRMSPKKYSTRLEKKLDFRKSVLFLQIQKESAHKNAGSALHLIVNLYALIVFPYSGKEMISQMGSMNKKELHLFMHERKKLIPLWIRAMLNVNPKQKNLKPKIRNK